MKYKLSSNFQLINCFRINCQQWPLGLRQFHASPALLDIQVVKVPAFADSVSEGDVRCVN